MKLYRCDLCGRVFDKKMAHICKEGNFRKRHLFFTEIDDVDNEYIKKSEVDVREKSFPNIPFGNLILEKPCQPKIEWMQNWEQIRAYAAVAAMQASLASPALMEVVTDPAIVVGDTYSKRLAQVCVRYADTLVEELKKDKQ
jgi:hypothetical protein